MVGEVQMLDDEFAARRAAEDRVWRAWYAALIAGVWSLIVTGFAARSESLTTPGLMVVSLDAIATLALGWAMQHWKSRFAAGLLTFRAISGGAVALTQGLVLRGVVSIAVFGTLYFLGLRGTMVLQRPWRPMPPVGTVDGEAGV